MAKSESPTETVKRLVELVVEHSLAELDIEQDGLHVNIKGITAAVAPAAVVTAHPTPAAVAAAAVPAPAVPAPETKSHLVPLELPMVGVFYRAPAPGDPPYINVGDTIRVGQTIGQIEAMKTFNDVPAEHAGRVIDIVVDNAKLVHQGETLVFLEPL